MSLRHMLNVEGPNAGRFSGTNLAIDVSGNLTKSITDNGSILIDGTTPPEIGPLSVRVDNLENDVNSNNGVNQLLRLDGNAKIPYANFPAGIDDIHEYPTFGDFPVIGENGIIYIALDEPLKSWRWSGSTYVDISGGVASVNGKTGLVTLNTDEIPVANDKNYISSVDLGKILTNESNISSLQSQTTTNTNDIFNLSTQTINNTTNISSLEQVVANNTAEITILQPIVSSNTSNIATNTNSIGVLQTTVSGHTTQITNNAGAISTLNSTVLNHTSQIANNTANIQANMSNIASNTSAINTNSTAIGIITTDVANLTSNVNSNTTAIAVNTANISNNSTAIAVNTANITTNASNIAANTANIATNTTNIATNASAIASTNTNLSNLATSVANNTTNITNNTTAIGANTSAITTLNNKIGAPNGICELDGGSKIPIARLPISTLIYKGVYDASTNTPVLSDATGVNGWVWNVSVAGTVNLGSGNIVLSLGDWLIHNGSIYEKSDNSDDVVSVNGKNGVVTLVTDDISDIGQNNKYVTLAEKNQIASNTAQIASNTINIATNTSDILTANVNISNNTANISTNTTDIIGLDIRVSQNETDIAQNELDIASNLSAINSNTANIGTLQTTVAGHTTSINSNTLSISGLETLTTNHSTDISALQTLTAGHTTSINTNTTNISSLQTSVNNINGDLNIVRYANPTGGNSEIQAGFFRAVLGGYLIANSIRTGIVGATNPVMSWNDIPTDEIDVFRRMSLNNNNLTDVDILTTNFIQGHDLVPKISIPMASSNISFNNNNLIETNNINCNILRNNNSTNMINVSAGNIDCTAKKITNASTIDSNNQISTPSGIWSNNTYTNPVITFDNVPTNAITIQRNTTWNDRLLNNGTTSGIFTNHEYRGNRYRNTAGTGGIDMSGNNASITNQLLVPSGATNGIINGANATDRFAGNTGQIVLRGYGGTTLDIVGDSRVADVDRMRIIRCWDLCIVDATLFSPQTPDVSGNPRLPAGQTTYPIGMTWFDPTDGANGRLKVRGTQNTWINLN